MESHCRIEEIPSDGNQRVKTEIKHVRPLCDVSKVIKVTEKGGVCVWGRGVIVINKS